MSLRQLLEVNNKPSLIDLGAELASSPFVSVVINNYYGTDKLKTCLSSIQESTYPNFEVIVSDCKTRGIKNWIKANFPAVRLIVSNRDIGVPASRNAGYSVSNQASKYVAFVDNDVKLDSLCLKNIVECLERNPEFGAAQPILFNMNTPSKIDSAGGFFDSIGYACTAPLVPELANNESRGQLDICYCEGITVVRRSVLSKLETATEPYDADYFLHWEDVDLCWRIMLAGYRVVLVTNSIAFHSRGVSSGLGQLSAWQVFLNTRNRLQTIIKNYDGRNLISFSPVLVLFELFKVVILLKNNNAHAFSTLKGLFWNFINFKNVWEKRVKVQMNVRQVPDSKLKNVIMRVSLTRLFNDYQRHYLTDRNPTTLSPRLRC